MDAIAEALDHIRKVPLLNKRMAARLLPVDPLALKAGLLGSNPEGLFKVVDTKPESLADLKGLSWTQPALSA